MRIKKLLALGLATVMAMTAFTACGGDKDKKTAEVIEIELTNEEYAFGVDKNQPELLAQVNSFIAEIKDNGTFEEICNRYFGDGEPKGVASAKLDESLYAG